MTRRQSMKQIEKRHYLKFKIFPKIHSNPQNTYFALAECLFEFYYLLAVLKNKKNKLKFILSCSTKKHNNKDALAEKSNKYLSEKLLEYMKTKLNKNKVKSNAHSIPKKSIVDNKNIIFNDGEKGEKEENENDKIICLTRLTVSLTFDDLFVGNINNTDEIDFLRGLM